MLQVKKSINLSGYSIVTENEQQVQVAYMSAQLSTDTGCSADSTTNTLNKEIYAKHRAEVRKDKSKFEEIVFAEEDRLIADSNKHPVGEGDSHVEGDTEHKSKK